MNRLRTMSLVIASMVGLLGASALAADAEPKWTTDYKAAVTQAKKEKKLILLDFTGSDWCGFCIKLHEGVFSKAEFAKWANKVVLVELDFPRAKPQPDAEKSQNAALNKKYKIEGYPTIIILNADEKEVAREVGYGGNAAADYLKKLDASIARGSK